MSTNDPRITAYVLGELSGEEAAEFKKLLESDAQLRQEVEEYKFLVTDVQSSFEENDESLQLGSEHLGKLVQAFESEPQDWFSKYKIAISAIATGLAVASLTYIVINPRSSRDMLLGDDIGKISTNQKTLEVSKPAANNWSDVEVNMRREGGESKGQGIAMHGRSREVIIADQAQELAKEEENQRSVIDSESRGRGVVGMGKRAAKKVTPSQPAVDAEKLAPPPPEKVVTPSDPVVPPSAPVAPPPPTRQKMKSEIAKQESLQEQKKEAPKEFQQNAQQKASQVLAAKRSNNFGSATSSMAAGAKTTGSVAESENLPESLEADELSEDHFVDQDASEESMVEVADKVAPTDADKKDSGGEVSAEAPAAPAKRVPLVRLSLEITAAQANAQDLNERVNSQLMKSIGPLENCVEAYKGHTNVFLHDFKFTHYVYLNFSVDDVGSVKNIKAAQKIKAYKLKRDYFSCLVKEFKKMKFPGLNSSQALIHKAKFTVDPVQ